MVYKYLEYLESFLFQKYGVINLYNFGKIGSKRVAK